METIKGKSREVWLDGLKGFACLLVILGHVLSGYLDAGTFPEAFWGLYRLRTWIYSFHMPLFFLISGFTFTLAYCRDGKLRRAGYCWQLLNLFWLYVAFEVLQWCVKQIAASLVNQPYDLGDLLNIFIRPMGNYWYLYVLFVLYVLAAAVGMCRRSGFWLIPLFGWAVFAVDADLRQSALTLYRCLYHLPFFFLGSLLCRHREKLRSEKLFGLCCVLLATAAYFYLVIRIRRWYSYWLCLIALSTCYFNVYGFFRWERISHVWLFRVCGKYALEIYLLHTFFTAGLRTVLPLAGITGPWVSVWLNFCLSTGASLGLAALAGRWRWTDVLFRPSRFIRRWKQTNSG